MSNEFSSNDNDSAHGDKLKENLYISSNGLNSLPKPTATVLNVPRPPTALMMLAQSATEKLEAYQRQAKISNSFEEDQKLNKIKPEIVIHELNDGVDVESGNFAPLDMSNHRSNKVAELSNPSYCEFEDKKSDAIMTTDLNCDRNELHVRNSATSNSFKSIAVTSSLPENRQYMSDKDYTSKPKAENDTNVVCNGEKIDNSNLTRQFIQHLLFNQLQNDGNNLVANDVHDTKNNFQLPDSKEHNRSLKEILMNRTPDEEIEDSKKLNYGHLTIFPVKSDVKVEHGDTASQPIDLSNRSHGKYELDSKKIFSAASNNMISEQLKVNSNGSVCTDNKKCDALTSILNVGLSTFQDNVKDVSRDIANHSSQTVTANVKDEVFKIFVNQLLEKKREISCNETASHEKESDSLSVIPVDEESNEG